MLKSLPKFNNPYTGEIVLEAVYTNRENPSQRGFYIGIADGIYTEFKGWDLVYTANATPRSFDVYKANGYCKCWAEENGLNLVLTVFPEQTRLFSNEQIYIDNYVLESELSKNKGIDASQKFIIVNSWEGPHEVVGARFLDRKPASAEMIFQFKIHHFKPFVIEYKFSSLPED